MAIFSPDGGGGISAAPVQSVSSSVPTNIFAYIGRDTNTGTPADYASYFDWRKQMKAGGYGVSSPSSSAADINPSTMQDPGAGYEGVPPEQYLQEYNHEWDEQAAKAQMDYQTAANKLAMDFSERMVDKQAALSREFRRTAYQDAVFDLKEAGLNPILAYQQGGAAMPSISAPQGITSAGAYARNSDTGYTYYSHLLDEKRLDYAYTQMVVNAATSVFGSLLKLV